MYFDLLSKLYYEERKKLEAMPVYQQETKLRIVTLKKRIITDLENALTLTQIKGRADIADQIKEKMLYDNEQSDKIEIRLSESIGHEMTQIDEEMKDGLTRTNYRSNEYADYLFQSEKVYALERVLEEEKLFPQNLYEQMKEESAREKSSE
jgi:hypothetical protein